VSAKAPIGSYIPPVPGWDVAFGAEGEAISSPRGCLQGSACEVAMQIAACPSIE